MDESYTAAITLWPAATLPASVADELRSLGVNLAEQSVTDGSFALRRTHEGTVVLDLSFDDCHYGLTGLEAVLATLRLARISYAAWDVKQGEVVGTGRAFDPASGIERQFSVTTDGEPVLTDSDLEEFHGRYNAADELIEAIGAWLRLPIPTELTDIADAELAIVTVPDEADEDDDRVETVGAVDGPPGAVLALTSASEDGC